MRKGRSSCEMLCEQRTWPSGVRTDRSEVQARSKLVLAQDSKLVLARGSKQVLAQGSKLVPELGSRLVLELGSK